MCSTTEPHRFPESQLACNRVSDITLHVVSLKVWTAFSVWDLYRKRRNVMYSDPNVSRVRCLDSKALKSLILLSCKQCPPPPPHIPKIGIGLTQITLNWFRRNSRIPIFPHEGLLRLKEVVHRENVKLVLSKNVGRKLLMLLERLFCSGSTQSHLHSGKPPIVCHYFVRPLPISLEKPLLPSNTKHVRATRSWY